MTVASESQAQSLFVVSLPRSMSTRVYRVARDATGLVGPSWAVGGEILNHDLLAMSRWPKLLPSSHKYVQPTVAPERACLLHDYLSDVTVPTGRIYKDVVHPFVLASWPGLTRFAILKIRRDLVEVAHAVLARGWHYPREALAPEDPLRRTWGARVADGYPWRILGRRLLRTGTHGRLTARLCPDAVLKGLVLADRALDALPGVEVHFRDLVEREDALHAALGALYPERPLGAIRYIDDPFVARRRRVEAALSPARRAALTERLAHVCTLV